MKISWSRNNILEVLRWELNEAPEWQWNLNSTSFFTLFSSKVFPSLSLDFRCPFIQQILLPCYNAYFYINFCFTGFWIVIIWCDFGWFMWDSEPWICFHGLNVGCLGLGYQQSQALLWLPYNFSLSASHSMLMNSKGWLADGLASLSGKINHIHEFLCHLSYLPKVSITWYHCIRYQNFNK